MKCSICDGDGVITFNKTDKNGYFNDAFFMKECSVCHGTGEVQTNDEWRKTCSAEEFAEWIRKDVCADSFWQRAYDWESWLKQPHTDKE